MLCSSPSPRQYCSAAAAGLRADLWLVFGIIASGGCDILAVSFLQPLNASPIASG
jgi:hypothetical protein